MEWTARPKIIVPLMGRTPEEIAEALPLIAASDADIVEWRIDHFESLAKDAVLAELSEIAVALEELPILCTVRTKAEGGQAELSDYEYLELISALGESPLPTLIDVEFRHPVATQAIEAARVSGAQVVTSHHDLAGRLSSNELLTLLAEMDAIADVAKVAINPVDEIQVAKVLLVSAKHSYTNEKPFMLLAMGALGGITRFTGELFGSCATFASLTDASALGQLSISQTKVGLDLLGEVLNHR